jgi:hypothetical protein
VLCRAREEKVTGRFWLEGTARSLSLSAETSENRPREPKRRFPIIGLSGLRYTVMLQKLLLRNPSWIGVRFLSGNELPRSKRFPGPAAIATLVSEIELNEIAW